MANGKNRPVTLGSNPRRHIQRHDNYPGMSIMDKLMALALLCTMTAAVLFQPVLMGPPRQVNVYKELDTDFHQAAE